MCISCEMVSIDQEKLTVENISEFAAMGLVVAALSNKNKWVRGNAPCEKAVLCDREATVLLQL